MCSLRTNFLDQAWLLSQSLVADADAFAVAIKFKVIARDALNITDSNTTYRLIFKPLTTSEMWSRVTAANVNMNIPWGAGAALAKPISPTATKERTDTSFMIWSSTWPGHLSIVDDERLTLYFVICLCPIYTVIRPASGSAHPSIFWKGPKTQNNCQWTMQPCEAWQRWLILARNIAYHMHATKMRPARYPGSS